MLLYPITEGPINMAFYAVDEWGKPVAGEPVEVRYIREDKLFAKWGVLNGVTDTNGYFRMRGTPSGPAFVCNFTRKDDGYYLSGFSDYQYPGPFVDGMVMTSVVRKVGNPINLWSSCVSAKGNEEPAEFGIDIVKGELMPPDGKGSVTDAVLRVSTELVGDSPETDKKAYKAHVTLDFLDPGSGILAVDGILTCNYKAPREAPADGKYISKFDREVTLDRHGKIEFKHEENAVRRYDVEIYRYGIFKVLRPSKTKPGEKSAFYGLVYAFEFEADYWRTSGYNWRFKLDSQVNGRPDDRNLERFGRQSEKWKDANFDRIDAEPKPEVLN